MNTRNFDAANYLKTDEDIQQFIIMAIKEKDLGHLARALGAAARAKGMTAVAEGTGLSRENLYRSLSGDRTPRWETIQRVLEFFNIELVGQIKAA